MRLNDKMINRELITFEKIVDKFNKKFPKEINRIDTEQDIGLMLINSLNRLTDLLCKDKARLLGKVKVLETLLEGKNKIIKDYEEETKFRPRG